MTRILLFILLLPCAACRSTGLPEGEGRGMVAWDRSAPEGAETWARPTWKAGDKLVYKKGANLYAYRVEEREGGGWSLVEEKSGLETHLTENLADLGQSWPDHPQSQVVYVPEDRHLHWPLWVGKRWSCHYLHKRADTDYALPMIVSYHCDRTEELTVPAGTFTCLRIWRRAKVAAPGSYLERVSLLWYAPGAGYWVRQLEGGTLLELQEVHRQ